MKNNFRSCRKLKLFLFPEGRVRPPSRYARLGSRDTTLGLASDIVPEPEELGNISHLQSFSFSSRKCELQQATGMLLI